MTKNKVCIGCNWDRYPECSGTKMFDGSFMNIENLKEKFECGVKNRLELVDLSIVVKSPEELKLEELEARILELETKTELEKN